MSANARIPDYARTKIIELRTARVTLREITRTLYRDHGIVVSQGHVCTIANEAGIRQRAKVVRSNTYKPIYDRPPFWHRRGQHQLSCGHTAYESKAMPGHCYACELRIKKLGLARAT